MSVLSTPLRNEIASQKDIFRLAATIYSETSDVVSDAEAQLQIIKCMFAAIGNEYLDKNEIIAKLLLMQIVIFNIPVEVIRKNIKNLHLSVLPPDGRVRVSAPTQLTNEAITMFVRTKLGWIKKQQEKFQQQPRQSERQYVSGETLYVWGKQYFLQVEYSYKGNALTLSGDKAILTVRKESSPKQRESFVNEWYRNLLKQEVAKYLPKWEKTTGLYCSSWQSKYMTTKWGTCNPTSKKIWLNLQLAKKPIECLEYVILHELAHLKVHNHSPEFTAILDKYMPYWREHKRRLNDSTLDYLPSQLE